MSDLTLCNFCKLQRIKARAAVAGKTVVVTARSERGFLEGREVTVDGKFVAWFAALGTRCEC